MLTSTPVPAPVDRTKITQTRIDIATAIYADRTGHYDAFRDENINRLTAMLRSVVDPFVDKAATDTIYAAGMRGLVACGWDVSASLWTGTMRHGIWFPDTGSKFHAASMLARNAKCDPAQLQARQLRLALVITPIITVRDVRNKKAGVRSLTVAEVLVMN